MQMRVMGSGRSLFPTSAGRSSALPHLTSRMDGREHNQDAELYRWQGGRSGAFRRPQACKWVRDFTCGTRRSWQPKVEEMIGIGFKRQRWAREAWELLREGLARTREALDHSRGAGGSGSLRFRRWQGGGMGAAGFLFGQGLHREGRWQGEEVWRHGNVGKVVGGCGGVRATWEAWPEMSKRGRRV